MDATDLSIRPTGRPRSCTCGVCKKCKHADYMRAYYRSKTPEERHRLFVAGRNPDLVVAREKARANSDVRRQSLRRSMARNPEKVAARRKLEDAVRHGRVKKDPCVECGATRVEGHHEDYSKPLEVVWYCRRHHVEAHRP